MYRDRNGSHSKGRAKDKENMFEESKGERNDNGTRTWRFEIVKAEYLLYYMLLINDS